MFIQIFIDDFDYHCHVCQCQIDICDQIYEQQSGLSLLLTSKQINIMLFDAAMFHFPATNKQIQCTMFFLKKSSPITYHLICQHKDCLNSESAGAEVEEVLERWAEQIHDEDIVFFFLAIISEREIIFYILNLICLVRSY